MLSIFFNLFSWLPLGLRIAIDGIILVIVIIAVAQLVIKVLNFIKGLFFL